MTKEIHYCKNCPDKQSRYFDHHYDVRLCEECADAEFNERSRRVVEYFDCGLEDEEIE